MEKPQDCFVKVGQINTRYWTMGSHHSPIILIHGIGGNVESWLPNFQALAAKHRVYALDLLGHGLTDKPLDLHVHYRYLLVTMDVVSPYLLYTICL